MHTATNLTLGLQILKSDEHIPSFMALTGRNAPVMKEQ
jgi:hypothetical protein